jgi:glucose/arabinose dehydrogenase
MKHKCVFVLLAAFGVLFGSPKAQSQQVDGCDLAAWVTRQLPNTLRTIEVPATDLRDTVITVNGKSQKISIPIGFTMTVFAHVDTCRGLACSPDGVIYATSYGGEVYALPDHYHRGVADSTIVVATGLNDPHGIGFYKGELYVSNNGALCRLASNGVSRAIVRKDTIALLPPSGDHHSRNFVFDVLKDKIYLQIGSYRNMDTTDFAHRAQIVEMNPDGSGYRTFARGIRNGVGMDLDPRTDALWVNNNGMDELFGSGTELTNNNPSESIYLVCDGANYGWPYCYAFQMRNPQLPWVNLDSNVVKTFDGPIAEVLAHSAPLGLHFYRGTKFPPQYRNAIFQCYHGSWDRSPPAPPRITVMWADSDGHNARVTDFVNGFFVMGSPPDSNTGSYFGRPVSIVEGGDSALYVSDDQAGVVYRIAYTAPPSSISPDLTGIGFKLGDPRPNPAGKGMRVDITLSEPSLVIADVFDQAGNRVKTIMDSEMDPGRHWLPIDTTNLASGSYILRVATYSGCESKKFVIRR